MDQHHRAGTVVATLSASLAIACVPAVAPAQDYRIERVLSGLQQPTYVTFAPGDDQTMYFMERTNGGGTNGTAAMGRVVKYDLQTQTTSTFINFAGIGGSVPNDSGSLCIAFHPDFQTNGKLYTTFAASPTPVTNELREYRVVNGVAQFERTVLRYNNNQGSFHTIDWIGFKHNAVGAERNYLYVTTGDGGPQSNDSTYVNRAQDLNQIYGKVLRLDVADGADAYPADPNKNFGIPPINTYAGAPAKLGEVIASGFRNPFRASFDRATNDLFIGDVGFNTQEEINFIRHETINPLQIVHDFGWPRREGIIAQPGAAPGIAGPKGDSIDPILYRTRSTTDDGVGDRSITGGYVYRGPIPSLQGRYIFADYISDHVYAINFDRNTNPATFNGTNYTDFEDLTTLWESLVLAGHDLQRISSFGEDNSGNLYFVSLADNLNSAYNSIGEGAIYRLVLIPEPASALLLLLPLGCAVLRRQRAGRHVVGAVGGGTHHR